MVSVAGDNVSGARRGGGTPVVPTIAQWSLVTIRVVNRPSQYSENAPDRDFFSLLKVPTSAFTIKNLLRHYPEWMIKLLNRCMVWLAKIFEATHSLIVGAFSGYCENFARVC